MPNILNTPTSPLFLVPGCVLVLVFALLLFQGYRRSRQALLLWAALGFAGTAGLALYVGSYFVLLPAFVAAVALYLRDRPAADAPPTTASPAVLPVAFRVQAQQAHVRFGIPEALQEAAVQGVWEQHVTAAPGTTLVLHVEPGTLFAAELWCDGQRLAHAAPSPPRTVTLQEIARAAGTPGA